MACVVTASPVAFSATDRVPLIYFLVSFPGLVLIAFCWLVAKQSDKLYAPKDFSNEENFMKLQLSAASLGAATGKIGGSIDESTLDQVARSVSDASPVLSRRVQTNSPTMLWVDDQPENNVYERRAFEAIDLRVELALTTAEALERLKHNKYAAIISDMARLEGSREGYALLDTLRGKNDRTPLFFYTTSRSPEHREETFVHGGQGCTNDPAELFEMVVKALLRQ